MDKNNLLSLAMQNLLIIPQIIISELIIISWLETST